MPLAAFLAEHDIIVNCVLQDTDAPLIFLDRRRPAGASRRARLIVDVSCDEGMGFSWARPTTFAEPTFVVGDNVHYYAVDHSPSYLWNSATWEISEALLPFLRDVHGGPGGLGRRPDHPPGHRDPRRRHPEPGDPVLPGPRAGVPARVFLHGLTAGPHDSLLAVSAEVAALATTSALTAQSAWRAPGIRPASRCRGRPVRCAGAVAGEVPCTESAELGAQVAAGATVRAPNSPRTRTRVINLTIDQC